jgi:hypothetical protein
MPQSGRSALKKCSLLLVEESFHYTNTLMFEVRFLLSELIDSSPARIRRGENFAAGLGSSDESVLGECNDESKSR